MLSLTKKRYESFINSCALESGEFRLTPKSESSPYALCFAIFGYQLLRKDDILSKNKMVWDGLLRDALDLKKEQTLKSGIDLIRSKPYLQLLCFTLSALHVLETLDGNPLKDHVEPLLPRDIEERLNSYKTFNGVAGTGNFAMFNAILLIHAKLYLSQNTDSQISRWYDSHLKNMNQNGFWGKINGMNHLQFQNGYHQYEIFEYLKDEGRHWQLAIEKVSSLVDSRGHYAPYPGGGGCFDYDAVFILTRFPDIARELKHSLSQTLSALISEQNADGGFCESLYIRPRSFRHLLHGFGHINAKGFEAKKERLKYFLNLQRPKHNVIRTHWTEYSREWNESDLWDSWFRMLTIARIDVALKEGETDDWGFINYPGIGYHHSIIS